MCINLPTCRCISHTYVLKCMYALVSCEFSVYVPKYLKCSLAGIRLYLMCLLNNVSFSFAQLRAFVFTCLRLYVFHVPVQFMFTQLCASTQICTSRDKKLGPKWKKQFQFEMFCNSENEIINTNKPIFNQRSTYTPLKTC